MNNLLKAHGWHIVVMSLIFIAFAVAIIMRGDDALQGITWTERKPAMETIAWDDASFNIGVYDYQQTFTGIDGVAIEHQFYDWNTFNSNEYSQWIQQLREQDRWPLVTIEPFSRSDLPVDSLLSDITNGQYDSQILDVCGGLESVNHPVFIRWGHEMERVTGRYPWAVEDAESYVAAYKYFVDTCNTFMPTTEVYYVWSPTGNHGLDAYYPGDDYVDYVGLSVYSFDEWEHDNYGRVRSFEENFGEKYERVKKYDKPIIIGEFGVNGTPEAQKAWITEMVTTSTNYPLLKTVVFFNAPDSPAAWGEEYSVPDWSIDPDVLDLE